MVNQATVMLKESRLAKMISDIESGRAVDYGEVAALQALDIARMGELFLLDRLEAEDEADRQMEELLKGPFNGGSS